MQLYMSTFAVLGFLYLMILAVAVVAGITGSIWIGGVGLLACSLGWWYCREHGL